MSWLILFIYVIICYGIANTIIYANGPFHCFVKMHEIANDDLFANGILVCNNIP